MLPGISGATTVEITSRIAGFKAAVLSASAANSVFVVSGTGGIASGIIGSGFMLFGRGKLFALQGRLERVPGEARAFHTDRKLPYACEHRKLAEVLDRLIGPRRPAGLEDVEQTAGPVHRPA